MSVLVTSSGIQLSELSAFYKLGGSAGVLKIIRSSIAGDQATCGEGDLTNRAKKAITVTHKG
jgi:hypothetical protein